jgi:hypothetical protein
MKLTDSVFYDSKGREIKRLHYNEDLKEPWTEKFQYSTNGYTKEIAGTRMDTVQFYEYSKLQKSPIKNILTSTLEMQQIINTNFNGTKIDFTLKYD